MRVAIVGGAGRMGRWLAKYFLERGHKVVISDTRQREARAVAASTGARFARDNLEAARDADLVVLSTPIKATPKVLREIATELKQPATVLEITSLKSQVIPILREIAERGVKTISVHPLFGPGVHELAREKVALVPVLDETSELEFARSLFPEAKIIVANVEEHDRAMAVTLSLAHFLNIAFASVIGEEDLDVLKKLSGTTFMLQLVLSEGVMAEDSELYASIQMDNEYSAQYLDKFLLRATTLKEQVAKKDEKGFSRFYADARSALLSDRDFAAAYERMYRALAAL